MPSQEKNLPQTSQLSELSSSQPATVPASPPPTQPVFSPLAPTVIVTPFSSVSELGSASEEELVRQNAFT